MLSEIRNIKLIGTLLIAAMMAVAAMAAPPLTITDSGYYLTEVDSAGVPSLVKIDAVVDLRTGKQPEPPKPDTPKPPTPQGIGTSVAQWASEVGDPKAAQRYALIFETVRDGVIDESISTDDTFQVLKAAADSMIDDDWTPFRRRLGDYLVDQSQRGNLSTKEQVADTLEMIRYGIAFTAIGSESLDVGDAADVVGKVIAIVEGR